MTFHNQLDEYVDELGGIFHLEDFEVIPFNHWRKDYEWLVMILTQSAMLQSRYPFAYIPVQALSAREAAEEAVRKLNIISEQNE